MTARVRSLEAETSRTTCFVAECQTTAFVRIKSRRKSPNSKGKQRSTPSAKSITHSGLICRRNRAAFRITTGIKQAAKPIMANRVRKAATTRTGNQELYCQYLAVVIPKCGFNNWCVAVCCAFSFSRVCAEMLSPRTTGFIQLALLCTEISRINDALQA